ncbi:MAG: ATP-binding protein, partial [Candidatus Omnitrophica bacterium]|nr:ATP-binding protein [Candidatus Omnitrophota bacterium]
MQVTTVKEKDIHESGKKQGIHYHEIKGGLPWFEHDFQLIGWGLDQILAITGAHAGSVFLWDEKLKKLVLNRARGLSIGNQEDIHLQLGKGIAGWVAQHGEGVLVEDVGTDGRFCEVVRYGKYQSSSFISVPLLFANRLLGVLNITEKEDRGVFTHEDLNRCMCWAECLSLAYETMRENRRVEMQKAEAQKKNAELEAALAKQAPLAALGKVVAHLAHELGNPLDGIRRYTNLALGQVAEDSLTREYLLKVKAGLRHSVRVIQGLLQFSKSCSRYPQRVSEVHEAIERGLAIFQAGQPSQEVQIEKAFWDGRLLVRDCGLAEVFLNLCVNALHAMKGHGTIRIRTELKDAMVSIIVSDSGCGIPEAVQKRLFEPFFTTKNEDGNGLGLSIVREIVEREGGTIRYLGAAHPAKSLIRPTADQDVSHEEEA